MGFGRVDARPCTEDMVVTIVEQSAIMKFTCLTAGGGGVELGNREARSGKRKEKNRKEKKRKESSSSRSSSSSSSSSSRRCEQLLPYVLHAAGIAISAGSVRSHLYKILRGTNSVQKMTLIRNKKKLKL